MQTEWLVKVKHFFETNKKAVTWQRRQEYKLVPTGFRKFEFTDDNPELEKQVEEYRQAIPELPKDTVHYGIDYDGDEEFFYHVAHSPSEKKLYVICHEPIHALEDPELSAVFDLTT